ncbi:putative haemagglutinin-like (or adhesin-like) with a signal peptide [Methylobacterium sp. 4-46]|uniref:hypothetical protein n=1 Tax=unclassified Methylobacterium TaxID=2615210 RepID=UPI000152D757|nr:MULTISPECIES: hypothetical protein [Methylobacterium]ACA18997.1 putative haemagglutinin-like (or adhesin-like) with a signal peptide [Methylobacterium sp. 4-46]WFT78213.1 hemagglutinin [Methylobacterium nodulans]
MTPAGADTAAGLLATDDGSFDRSLLSLGTLSAGLSRQITAATTYGGLRAGLAATFGAGLLTSLDTALASSSTRISAHGPSFTLDGAVASGGDFAVTTTAAGAPITLAAALDAGRNAVTLAAAGAVAQTAGTLTAGTLTASAAGGLALGAANQVGRLARLTNAGSGDLAFTNAGALTIGTGAAGDGVSNPGGTVTLIAAAGSLTLATGAGVRAAGDVALATSGAFVNRAGAEAVARAAGAG